MGHASTGVEASPIRPRAEDLNLIQGENLPRSGAPGFWAPRDGRHRELRRAGEASRPPPTKSWVPGWGTAPCRGGRPTPTGVSVRLHGGPDPTRERVATRACGLGPEARNGWGARVGCDASPCTVGESARATLNTLSSGFQNPWCTISSPHFICPRVLGGDPGGDPEPGCPTLAPVWARLGVPECGIPFGEIPCRGLMKPRHGPLSKGDPASGEGGWGPGQCQCAPSGLQAGVCVPRLEPREGVGSRPWVRENVRPLALIHAKNSNPESKT